MSKEYGRLFQAGIASRRAIEADNPLMKNTIDVLITKGAVIGQMTLDGDTQLRYTKEGKGISQGNRKVSQNEFGRYMQWLTPNGKTKIEQLPPVRLNNKRVLEVDYENLTITGEERTIFDMDKCEGARE